MLEIFQVLHLLPFADIQKSMMIVFSLPVHVPTPPPPSEESPRFFYFWFDIPAPFISCPLFQSDAPVPLSLSSEQFQIVVLVFFLRCLFISILLGSDHRLFPSSPLPLFLINVAVSAYISKVLSSRPV